MDKVQLPNYNCIFICKTCEYKFISVFTEINLKHCCSCNIIYNCKFSNCCKCEYIYFDEDCHIHCDKCCEIYHYNTNHICKK